MIASNILRKSIPQNGSPWRCRGPVGPKGPIREIGPIGTNETYMTSRGSWRFVAAMILGLACQFATVANAATKIGAVTCLSGPLSTFGVSSVQGAKLAAEEINSSGGILGQPLELIVEDNQSKAGEAATAARKFISQDRVVAIVGDLTSSAT